MDMPPLYCAPVKSGPKPPTHVGTSDQARARHNPSPLKDDGEPLPFNNNRKRSRTLRFPCKARGVPDNHNARTAYIDIPPSASHGAVVICSHPVCASSGRKFRYCAVCMVPVAKRNFSKRHGHGLLCTPELPYVEVGEEEAGDDASSRSKRQRFNSFNNADMARALEIIAQDDDDNNKEEQEELKVPHTITPPSDEAVGDSSVASSIESTFTVKERQWLALFRNRPMSSNSSQAVVRTWIAAILEKAELNASNYSSDDGAMESRDEETSMKQEEESGDKEEENKDSSIFEFSQGW